ncbi:MAG TPA: hypothetical protein VE650_09425, partial [Acetobacteraceae bacterium]|nr:hypothetical protein [Acetobacteraceae bacterium]
AVPKGVPRETLDVVLALIGYLLEPAQQAYMYDHGYMYPGPAIRGVTMALGRNPEAVAAMREAGWEIATHGIRWNVAPPADEAGEREEIEATLALHEALCGSPALG